MAQLVTMQTIFKGTIAQQQERYRRYIDKKVKSLPVFTVRQTVYVNSPSLITITTEWEASPNYNKQLPRTTGLFKILEVRDYIPKLY